MTTDISDFKFSLIELDGICHCPIPEVDYNHHVCKKCMGKNDSKENGGKDVNNKRD